MVTIRKIQSRDVQSLSDTFPHMTYDYFDTLYIDHLQDTRLVFVAVNKDDNGDRYYFAYASILWESTYTQFWRRNIPEITDLYVHEDHRKQGLASRLISECEKAIQEKGFSSVGISVKQTDAYRHAQELYETLGYTADGEGITSHDEQLHMVKIIK